MSLVVSSVGSFQFSHSSSSRFNLVYQIPFVQEERFQKILDAKYNGLGRIDSSVTSVVHPGYITYITGERISKTIEQEPPMRHWRLRIINKI
jgi:hypothetical protein